jgi:hypothetical protein
MQSCNEGEKQGAAWCLEELLDSADDTFGNRTTSFGECLNGQIDTAGHKVNATLAHEPEDRGDLLKRSKDYY